MNPTFITLIRQEFFRFGRLAKQTILPPILTTLLFILIFGFSLGDRIKEIHGFSYILYIIPGLAAMGVMNSAFSNSSSSLYIARFDLSIENILVTPIRSFEIVGALILGAVARGFLVGAITLIVALALLRYPPAHPGILFSCLILQSILFGCFGIVEALRAKTWDTLATTQNFILTPMVYLGGVFYSINLLPHPWKAISLFNPIFYMVDAMRYGVLGTSEIAIAKSFGITLALTLGFFLLCIYLFQRGYNLVK